VAKIAVCPGESRSNRECRTTEIAAAGIAFTTLLVPRDGTLWKINVGTGFNAPPMTFEVNGRQYIAILSGLSASARGKHQLIPELRELRNQTMLFVFSL
jgi:hypothetical protein